MNSTPSLSGAHLRTYETIFRHPLAHNLNWRDVRSLLAHLGQVVEEDNGNLKVTRHGQTHLFQKPRNKDVEGIEEMMALRNFLERTDTPVSETGQKEAHWLVVIDHHEARIFRLEMNGSEPRQILPHRPEDHFRHAHNSKDFTRGMEKPEPNSFFEPIARALKDAENVLLMGNGKGAASETAQFLAWLPGHHPELEKRIVGALNVDQHHLTDGQLLEKAREFYESQAALPS